MIFKGINLNIYTIGIVFFIINLVMLIIAPYDVHLAQGADAGSWYHPALSLLKHGSFVTLEDTTVLQTYRPPLYLMYEAFMLFIGNGNIVSIIIGQILLLWLTGRIMYKIVERIFPKKGILALVLVIASRSSTTTGVTIVFHLPLLAVLLIIVVLALCVKHYY